METKIKQLWFWRHRQENQFSLCKEQGMMWQRWQKWQQQQQQQQQQKQQQQQQQQQQQKQQQNSNNNQPVLVKQIPENAKKTQRLGYD